MNAVEEQTTTTPLPGGAAQVPAAGGPGAKKDKNLSKRPRIVAGQEAERLLLTHHFAAFPKTDQGLGARVWHYQNGVYRRSGEDIIQTALLAQVGTRWMEKLGQAVIAYLRNKTKREEWEMNPDAKVWINCKNTEVNWMTGETRSHDPSHLSTIQIDAPYDPDARSEILDGFIKSILVDPKGDDPRDAFWELVGLLMIPETKYEVIVALAGSGGNGKSTVIKLLERFIGPQNVTHLDPHDIEDRTFRIAELECRRSPQNQPRAVGSKPARS